MLKIKKAEKVKQKNKNVKLRRETLNAFTLVCKKKQFILRTQFQ